MATFLGHINEKLLVAGSDPWSTFYAGLAEPQKHIAIAWRTHHLPFLLAILMAGEGVSFCFFFRREGAETC